MILDGRMMKFASRKQLNQQKKAEKQINPARPAHLSKKQMVGKNAFSLKSLKRKTLVRPAGWPRPGLRRRQSESSSDMHRRCESYI
jgi:hypothetical protein